MGDFVDKKVILISVDGMRPDGMQSCGNPYVKELEKLCSYTYEARTVFPSITLPCHFSMAHSVVPQRHGILSNTYVPQVRPVDGIFEKVKAAGGMTALFNSWDQLRDIVSPGTLSLTSYINYKLAESGDTVLTQEALRMIGEYKPDFAFLFLADTDNAGHAQGWMSGEYIRRISIAVDNIRKIVEAFGKEYSIFVMADHGGHDRMHGLDIPEDMTIPLFFCGADFTPGRKLEGVSLLDMAPTIAAVMGIHADPDWEGKSLVENS